MIWIKDINLVRNTLLYHLISKILINLVANKTLILNSSINLKIDYEDVCLNIFKLIEIINILENKNEDSKLDIKQHKFIKVKNLPQQDNNKDCGVFCLDFLGYIVEKDISIFKLSSEIKRFNINQLIEMDIKINIKVN